jgi:Zn-dependent protease
MAYWYADTRSRRDAFRPSAVFLGIVAVFVTGGLLSWYDIGSATVNIIVFVLAGWLVSLCLHEYAHALYAYLRGDRSAADRGYLTLNPLKYTHPVLSIVLPVVFLLIGGIGLPGGAVWLDRHAIRGGKVVQSLVSLVGPGANLVFGVLLALPFLFGVPTFAHANFWFGMAFLAFLQMIALLLNLLPIPGVDGGNAVRPWLNLQWARIFDVMAPYGMLLLFLLLFASPLARAVFFDFVYYVCGLLNIGSFPIDSGRSMFQFWVRG